MAYRRVFLAYGIALAVFLALALLSGVGFYAAWVVGEPVRMAQKGPVEVTGTVLAADMADGRNLIRYTYEAAALPYEQVDFVKGAVKAGDTVSVTYWKVNPHMSHTSLSQRSEMARELNVRNGVILLLGLLIGGVAWQSGRRAKARMKSEAVQAEPVSPEH